MSVNLLFFGSLILMLIGLAGVVIPILPGLPLIFFAYLIFAWLTDWQIISPWFVAGVGVVTIIGLLFDYWAWRFQVKKYEVSRSGFWGAILGSLFGLVIFNIIGMVVGAMAGAFIGELVDGKPHPVAWRSAKLGIVAILAGGFFRLIVGIILVGLFFWLVLTA